MSPNHSSMQIVQICPAPSTFSSVGPLPGAEARSACALDEPVSLRSQSHSLLRLSGLAFNKV